MRRILVILALSLTTLVAASERAAAQPLPSGYAADVTGRRDFRDLGRAPAGQLVRIGLTLNYQHEAELARLVMLQSDRRSPLYHHFLTNEQFNNYFAPPPAAYLGVIGALGRAGFVVTQTFPNRTIVDAVGTVAAAERYFATEIHRVYQFGVGFRYANSRPALMPVQLRGVVGSVSGLNNLIIARPLIAFGRRRPAVVVPLATPVPNKTPTPAPNPTTYPTGPPAPNKFPTPVPNPTTYPTGPPVPNKTSTPAPTPTPTASPIGGALNGPDTGFGPVAFANGYDLPVQHGFNGAGHATGVAISGDFLDSDLAAFLSQFGITRTGPATTRVAVDGGASFGITPDSEEATLDVEAIVSLAPGTHLYMYLFPDLSDVHIEDGYNRAVSDGIVDALNSSFGGCETSDTSFDTTSNSIAVQGAAKGITFAASSGDFGSKNCGPNNTQTGVSAPASNPEFMAIGGTSLTVTMTGAYSSETAWSGSGGGVSVVFTRPTYQQSIAGTSSAGRNVPDIAFDADPNTGFSWYFDGGWHGPIGGTSLSSPIYCALQTEINQRQNSRAGFVNARIYSAFTTYGYSVYHDITTGSNGGFSAHSGYDNVTGIGSAQGFALSGVL